MPGRCSPENTGCPQAHWLPAEVTKSSLHDYRGGKTLYGEHADSPPLINTQAPANINGKAKAMLYHGHAPKAGSGGAAGSCRCNPQAEHPARTALWQKDLSLSTGPALVGTVDPTQVWCSPTTAAWNRPVLLRTATGTANTQLV